MAAEHVSGEPARTRGADDIPPLTGHFPRRLELPPTAVEHVGRSERLPPTKIGARICTQVEPRPHATNLSHETSRNLVKDGYRALAGRWADGRVAVRSRNGSDLARAFPEIEEAVRWLPVLQP